MTCIDKRKWRNRIKIITNNPIQNQLLYPISHLNLEFQKIQMPIKKQDLLK